MSEENKRVIIDTDILNEMWSAYRECSLSGNFSNTSKLAHDIHKKTGVTESRVKNYIDYLAHLSAGTNILPPMKVHELNFFMKKMKEDASSDLFYNAVKTLRAVVYRDDWQIPDDKREKFRQLVQFYTSASLMKTDDDTLKILEEKQHEPLMFKLENLPPLTQYISKFSGKSVQEMEDSFLLDDPIKPGAHAYFIIEGSPQTQASDMETAYRQIHREYRIFFYIDRGMFINRNLQHNYYHFIFFDDPNVPPIQHKIRNNVHETTPKDM